MTTHSVNFAALLEDFFTRRLIQQRQASPHTITYHQFLSRYHPSIPEVRAAEVA